MEGAASLYTILMDASKIQQLTDGMIRKVRSLQLKHSLLAEVYLCLQGLRDSAAQTVSTCCRR